MPASSENKQKVLITGASGFIGGHLCDYLLSTGYEVHALSKQKAQKLPGAVVQHSCDFSDPHALTKVLEGIEAEFIVHLAGRSVPGRDFSEFSLQYENTVQPTVNLALAIPTSTKLALFCGSCEEYGNGPVPFREENCPVAFSPYGWAKISSYFAASMILRQRGLSWCWARPFLTFGPGQESDLLIPTLIRGCQQGREVPLSPGLQTRDLIFVHDLCEMFGAILANPARAGGEVINLCSGKPRTVKVIAETIQRIVGKGSLHFGALPYRAEEAMEFFGSNEKFIRLFGERRLTSFESAIRSTLEHYSSQEK